jgi:hypothetical protein
VVSEQGSALAYAVTEGVRLGSRTTYAAPRLIPEYDSSMSRIDTRTQTEGPSSYGYSLSSTKSQANTTSSRTRKATNTESICNSATDTSGSCNSDRTLSNKIEDHKT